MHWSDLILPKAFDLEKKRPKGWTLLDMWHDSTWLYWTQLHMNNANWTKILPSTKGLLYLGNTKYSAWIDHNHFDDEIVSKWLMKSTFRPNGWMTDKVVEWRIKWRIRWRRDFDIPLFTFIHFPPLSIFINFHPFLSNVIHFHSFHHVMCFCNKCPLWTSNMFLLYWARCKHHLWSSFTRLPLNHKKLDPSLTSIVTKPTHTLGTIMKARWKPLEKPTRTKSAFLSTFSKSLDPPLLSWTCLMQFF